MGLGGGVISNLLSSVGKLFPSVSEFVQTRSSSSSSPVEGYQIEAELKALMRMLERIKATSYDVEGREIMDHSVKLCLKELKQVAYSAEDVLDEYNYEILHAQIEARDASQPDSRKRKLIQMPDGMLNEIKHIKDKFDEIEKHHVALRLSDDDGPRRYKSELQIVPTGHFVKESDIFGRETEKGELMAMLSSDCDDEEVDYVVTIIGTGGLGKTTLAQIIYSDQRIRQRFDKFGWICVSEDFNVQRLTREAIESITGSTCILENLSALQNKISEEIKGKQVLLILDDVWNENRILWEAFRGPLLLAKEIKILVTTRNESVAKIMNTAQTFNLDYMSSEQCWQLFKHYAFGDVKQNKNSDFLEIAKHIFQKCGKLPLAIKSIATLLRHETKEENWIDILNSEIWNSDELCDYIFTPLQISYARLPTCMKPCFLYCSMFPKDYTFSVRKLVALWISQGYIESNGKKSAENIGHEYAKHLWQRSFFEGKYEESEFARARFKLHDIVHDFARLISEDECYSIEVAKDSKFPRELYHLYVKPGVQLEKSLSSSNYAALRTLIISSGQDFDISKARRLRALKLKYWYTYSHSELCFSVCHLKHLRYLSLAHCPLPEYLCFLHFLRNLSLRRCNIVELPESIGNLVGLEELVIDKCRQLKWLPIQMGGLKNLRTLKICRTMVSSLPPSLNKIIGNIQTLQVRLTCKTIGWLKDFVDLKGTLFLEALSNMISLADAECANLVSMHNLECLTLYWNKAFFQESEEDDDYVEYFSDCEESRVLQLDLIGRRNPTFDDEDPLSLMEKLQPHRNLSRLHISGYSGVAFPKWIRDATTCRSFERIDIVNCQNLTSISLGNNCKLKYLDIYMCCYLEFLEIDSLPLLQELKVSLCPELRSVCGIQKLKSLIKLSIDQCENLERWVMDTKPSVQNSLLGLANLTSLRSLKIHWCSKLRALVDEPRPVGTCEVKIGLCPLLNGWCLNHKIPCEGVVQPFSAIEKPRLWPITSMGKRTGLPSSVICLSGCLNTHEDFISDHRDS